MTDHHEEMGRNMSGIEVGVHLLAILHPTLTVNVKVPQLWPKEDTVARAPAPSGEGLGLPSLRKPT